MMGTFELKVLSTRTSFVLGEGEVVVGKAVVVVNDVVVVAGHVYSGHGHPFGHPAWHGHCSRFAFKSFYFIFILSNWK